MYLFKLPLGKWFSYWEYIYFFEIKKYLSTSGEVIGAYFKYIISLIFNNFSILASFQ